MLRHALIVGAAVFILGSVVPGGSFGCLHQARLEFGLPLPWFGVDVKYGRPKTTNDPSLPYVPGKIDKVEGWHVYWTVLPFSLAGSLVVGLVLTGTGKGLLRLLRLLQGRRGHPRNPAVMSPER